jgi:hypothetical protein
LKQAASWVFLRDRLKIENTCLQPMVLKRLNHRFVLRSLGSCLS